MPSTGQPVIIKNKIVYGYMDKATVCRDMGRADYNDLTEAQQLNGDVYFIQGVDASAFAPTNSLWNKVGTTPLDSELPADCSNAINQLKSNLTELIDVTQWHHETVSVMPSVGAGWSSTSAIQGLSNAKRVIACCSNGFQGEFANVGSSFTPIQTFSYRFNDTSTDGIYKTEIHLRVNFATQVIEIRYSVKGTQASTITLTDIYWI